MKKLLIMLVIVAMAAFLFVGCIPTVPEEPVEPVEPVPVVAKTDTPYITWINNVSLYSTDTQYTKNPAVKGVGVPGAIIRVYIDGVQSGVGSTGASGSFGGDDGISVSLFTLTEGVRKLYVTATVPGLAESDKSTEYTFTYDKTAPTILSVVGDESDNYITVTFSEAVKANTVITAGWKYSHTDFWQGFIEPEIPVAKVVAASSTAARLYPIADCPLVADSIYLSVKCSGTVTDLAGNEIVPVTVYGFVFP